MKFIKGVMVGGLITTGVVLMCSEAGYINTNMLMKKGKKAIKKMGII